jgi:NitT/TauT family transport system ATP-binding protein
MSTNIQAVPKLTMTGVGKSFDVVRALDDVNVAVHKGEFIAIVGPSGCGKTTLLRIAAGLEEPTTGAVLLDGRAAGGPGPQRGMVFQKFALFPHMTVVKNIDFGLELKKVPRAQRKEIIMRYLRLLGLESFAQAYPRQLSGGMQQRVAIARSLVIEPEILLMDEPFASLDAQIRISMQEMLLELVRQTHITTLFVTHSVEEAVYLADKVFVLSQRPGTVSQVVDIGQTSEWKRMKFPQAEQTAEFLALKKEVWGLIRH